jgi:hypothetical protein
MAHLLSTLEAENRLGYNVGVYFILDPFVLQPAETAVLPGKSRLPFCRPPAGSEPSPCPADSVRLHALKLLPTFAARAKSLNPPGRCLALRRDPHALQALFAWIPMASSPVLCLSPAAPVL